MKFERAPQDGTISRALLAKLVSEEPLDEVTQRFVSFGREQRFLVLDLSVQLTEDEAELIERLW